jgi:VCBS repeat-containing protein
MTGTNDAAVITGTSTANLTETDAASSLSTTGKLSATDVDSSALFVAQTGVSGSNGYGKFSIGTDGAWTYTANSAHNEFVGGTEYSDSVTVATADGTTQVITVSMTGTNDAATVSGTTTGTVTEADAITTATGTLKDTDPDNTANTFQAVSTSTASTKGYGAYTMTAGGTWTYTLDNANAIVLALNSGQTLDDTFTVKTQDGTQQTVAVTIKGSSGYLSLSSLASGTSTLGFVINGECNNDSSGYSVSAAGDVNGDGLTDVIVSAPYATNGAGRSYVVFGKTSSLAVNLSDLLASSNTLGFVIKGECANDNSGYSVSAAGDMNGDGLADLIVGVPYATVAGVANAGLSYVVFGKTSGTSVDLSSLATGSSALGFVIKGQGSYSGFSVSEAGDVNGDGLADVIIGAPGSDEFGLGIIGQSYVVFGKTNTVAVDLTEIATGTSTLGFEIKDTGVSNSGWSVSAAGDVNGDGLADLIINAPSIYSLRSYVVFGKTSNTTIDVNSLSSGFGFAINSEDSKAACFSVSAAGDVNGDGLADVIVGAKGAATNGYVNGRSYVVFGKTSSTAIDLTALVSSGNTLGFVINGQCSGDQSGYSVSAAGDVNGDGLADVIVGANSASTSAGTGAGRSYVVFGKTSGTAVELSAVAMGTGGFVINGQCSGDDSGISVSAAGDVNGDGLADLIVGADGAVAGTAAGRSYVIFGSTSGAFANTAVDQLGTSGNDTLISPSTSGGGQTLVGGAGNDTLTSGAGADVLYGGAGNDIFVVSAGMATALLYTLGSGGNTSQLARIDGGTGIDTLRLASGSATAMAGTVFDLTSIKNAAAGSSRLNSVEVLDLSADATTYGIVGNQLKLALSDVLDMTGMNVFNSSNTSSSAGTALASSVPMHQLMIWGDATDVVTIGLGSWVKSTNNTAITYGGHTMAAYTYNSSSIYAQLLVDTNIVTAGHLTFIKGVADTPTITPITVNLVDTVSLDAFSDTSGSLTTTYVNTGTPLTFGLTDGQSGTYLSGAFDLQKIGTFETLYVNSSTGNYKFVANATTVNALGATTTGEDFTVTASESGLTGTQTLRVNVTGVNDAPVLATPSAISLTDTTAYDTLFSSTTGTLSASDVDTGSSVTFGLTSSAASTFTNNGVTFNLQSTGKYGTLYVNSSSGAYVFVPDASLVNAVGGGSDSFTVSASDGSLTTTQALSVNVTSTNTAAVITGTLTGTLTENSSTTTATATLSVTDTDGTTGFRQVTTSASTKGFGTYAVTSAGKWTYKLDNTNTTVQALNTGESTQDTFSVYSTDGTSKTVTITINGNSGYLPASSIAAGNGGFVIDGACISDASGWSVSTAGDVNGDGLADVIVGAIYAAPAAGTSAGRSYVVFGKTSTSSINLSDLLSSSNTLGFVINGQGSSDLSGNSVSAAGDVNGDGLADLIVGAPNSDPATGTDAGRSYVVFGKTSSTTIDLSTIAAGSSTLGFVINGQCSGDQSGYSVSAAGDVNGDGLADLIVGAPYSDPVAGTDAGRSYVVFGKSTGSAINLSDIAPSSGIGTGGFVINGASFYSSYSAQSGWSVSAAGDVNGDGFADLIVGAPRAYSTGSGPYANSGRSFVVFGKSTTSAIDLSTIAAGSSLQGFVINGQCVTEGGLSGWSVSAAGDVNGDGLADLIVGAPNVSTSATIAGRSYVVFGKASAAAIELSDVALGNGGFTIDSQESSSKLGASVSAAGDVNGDGLADLLVGSYGKDGFPGPVADRGSSYVIFGSTTGVFAKTAVDQLGTSSADTLTSTSTSGGGQTLVGGAGNDTLTSGTGADVLYGGAGNDTFVVTSAMVAALQNTFGSGGNATQLARIDGGTGIDTLRLTGGANLDLTAVSNAGSNGGLGLSRIASVEVIDMATDTTANTTTLALKDVLDMAGMNVFNSSTTGSSSGTALASSVAMHQLMIWGTAADYVNIGVSNWTKSTTNTAITYTDINNTVHTMTAYTYNSSTVFAQLLIENSIVNASAHVT